VCGGGDLCKDVSEVERESAGQKERESEEEPPSVDGGGAG